MFTNFANLKVPVEVETETLTHLASTMTDTQTTTASLTTSIRVDQTGILTTATRQDLVHTQTACTLAIDDQTMYTHQESDLILAADTHLVV